MTSSHARADASSVHWDPVPLSAVLEARQRTQGVVPRTPLVPLDAADGIPPLWLKLESLQPVRSFKVRGALNTMLHADPAALADGVWTVSSGNMAQAVAWSARRLGVPATVYVPQSVPRTKVANVLRYGGTVIELPLDEWVEIFLTRRREDAPGLLIHPYSHPDIMAGNGVIGLEILEDLPEVAAVIVPWGGGGLGSGVAAAVKALRPDVRLYASESASGAPLAPSLAAGHPVTVPYEPGFCDGIAHSFINDEMLALAARLLDGAIVVSREETAAAARLIMERASVIPEGAAATAVAAALTGQAGPGPIACVISGGNVDTTTLITLLQGKTPA